LYDVVEVTNICLSTDNYGVFPLKLHHL
jgi:hypothetical protein